MLPPSEPSHLHVRHGQLFAISCLSWQEAVRLVFGKVARLED